MGSRCGFPAAVTPAPTADRPATSTCRLSIEEDERFHREGRELYTVMDLPAHAAMLGREVEIETLDGPEEIKLDSGMTHGDESRSKATACQDCATTRAAICTRWSISRCRTTSPPSSASCFEDFDDTITDDNFKPAGREGIMSRLRRALR